MDTTRYTKPRPCLPSLQRSRSSRTRVAAPGRARAVSLDEVSDRSLSRDDLVWEARMCLEPMKQRSSIDAAVVALDRVVAVIFTQRTLDAIGRRDAHVLSTIVRAAASSGHDQL